MSLVIKRVTTRSWCRLPGYRKVGLMTYEKTEGFRYFVDGVEVDILGQPIA